MIQIILLLYIQLYDQDSPININLVFNTLISPVFPADTYSRIVDASWKCPRIQMAGIEDDGLLGFVWLLKLKFCSTGLNSELSTAAYR